MRRSDAPQLQPPFTVVYRHEIAKDHRRLLQAIGGQAVVGALAHLIPFGLALDRQLAGAILRADDGDPLIRHHAVALRVIPVIVRVEDVADWLARRLSDLRQDVADAPWRVRFDHDDEIPELDPAGVRRLPCVAVAKASENARRNLAHGSDLALQGIRVDRGEQQQHRSGREKSSHRIP